jgi:hypothetical protein
MGTIGLCVEEALYFTKEVSQLKSPKKKSNHEKWKGGIAFLKISLLSNKKLTKQNPKTN